MSKILGNGQIIFHEVTEPLIVQANYLASNQDDYVTDDLISIATGLMPWNWGTPGASHTEKGFFLDGKLYFFSSTSRKELNGGNGTRWVEGAIMLRNPERWMLQVKRSPIRDRDTAVFLMGIRGMAGRANAMIGLLYDMRGVFTDFTIPWRIFFKKDLDKELKSGKLKKIYCSKATDAIESGKLRVVSPRRSVRIATSNGYVKVGDTWKWMANHNV